MKPRMLIKKAYKEMDRGVAMLIAVLFFLSISLIVVAGFSGPLAKETALAQELTHAKATYYLAESGTEDAFYRIKNSMQLDGTELLALNGGTTTTLITDIGLDEKRVLSQSNIYSKYRNVETVFTSTTGVNLQYGILAGEGGVTIDKEVTISGIGGQAGNIYSNGDIIGSGESIIITGSATIGTPGTTLQGVEVYGDARANTIDDTVVGGDAYYQTISNTTVGGTSYPASADPDPHPLPISDATIAAWKADAEAGSVINGDCPGAAGCTDPMGPVKIDGNFSMSKEESLTLTGIIYVTGNINIAKESEISCDISFGANDCVLMADGYIDIDKEVELNGSGHPDSYLLLLTTVVGCEGGTQQSQCAPENSGIHIDKEIEGGIIYAANSNVSIDKEVELVAVVGKGVDIDKEVEIEFQSVATSLDISTGGGGGWYLQSWREVE